MTTLASKLPLTPSWHLAQATRIEDVCIKFDLDRRQLDGVMSLVQTILGREPPDVFDGDTLKITYDFHVAYLGKVEEIFNAILNLLINAPDVIVKVDGNLLDGASCLFARLIEKLHQINEVCNSR